MGEYFTTIVTRATLVAGKGGCVRTGILRASSESLQDTRCGNARVAHASGLVLCAPRLLRVLPAVPTGRAEVNYKTPDPSAAPAGQEPAGQRIGRPRDRGEGGERQP